MLLKDIKRRLTYLHILTYLLSITSCFHYQSSYVFTLPSGSFLFIVSDIFYYFFGKAGLLAMYSVFVYLVMSLLFCLFCRIVLLDIEFLVGRLFSLSTLNIILLSLGLHFRKGVSINWIDLLCV